MRVEPLSILPWHESDNFLFYNYFILFYVHCFLLVCCVCDIAVYHITTQPCIDSDTIALLFIFITSVVVVSFTILNFVIMKLHFHFHGSE